MGIMDGYAEEQEREKREREGWHGDYDNRETGCINCGRFRVIKCANGKRVCEKCGWDQEKNEQSDMPSDMIG